MKTIGLSKTLNPETGFCLKEKTVTCEFEGKVLLAHALPTVRAAAAAGDCADEVNAQTVQQPP